MHCQWNSKTRRVYIYIYLINFLFVKDVLSNESLEPFSNYFPQSDDFHDHMTRHSSRHSVIMELSNTNSYGSFSIRNETASSWKFLQSKLNTDVTSESHNKAKEMVKLCFINLYKDQ